MFSKDVVQKVKDLSLEKLKNMNFDVDQYLIEEATGEVQNLIDYKMIHQVCDNFHIDERENKIIFKTGDYLFGDYIVKNLKEAEYIILAIITLGDRIDKRVNDYFSESNYTKGMILDVIAGVFLEILTNNFWEEVRENAQKYGKEVTDIFYPGNKWDIKNQAVICKLVDSSKIGVNINHSFIITPQKTVSFVCGVGENVKRPVKESVCDDCEAKDCIYRNVPGESKYKVTVRFSSNTKVIEASEGENLFHILVRNGIRLNNFCGGSRICGQCKVILNEELDISDDEKYFLTDKEIKNNVRLACFVEIDRDLEVKVLSEEQKAKILTKENNLLSIESHPRIKTSTVDIRRPTLNDQRDYVKRIKEAVGGEIEIPLELLSNLPEVLEENDYKVNITIRKNEIISIKKAASKQYNYGIALDIGTTTIAAYLYDLDEGKEVDVYSCLNPQRTFGADVITRITYSISNSQGLYQLHSALINKINEIVEEFCVKNSIDKSDIHEIVAVGNPTMIHFLLNVSSKNIAISPYVPTFTSKIEVKAKEIGININKEGYVITLPLISSYVGADTVAAVLANKIDQSDELCLLVDIGTNGEMVLGNKDNLIASSVAAGPAFEGAGITFGLNGVEGAIDHVDFSKRPFYTTIGNKKAKGICGSGIVDIISELLKYGIVDITGRFLSKEEVKNVPVDIAERITLYKDEPAFLIENGIYVTQKDIRQIQLAKSAILAGINIMIKEMGIDVNEIKKVFLAGGFGNYILPASAITIGLLPKELQGKILQVGNSAGVGAIMALLSDKELERSIHLQSKISYIELSTHEDFQNEFVKGMYF
jgi:uncharacterized 2Fe-2S/4Fe-4S cluster protein (DUF4445 family)